MFQKLILAATAAAVLFLLPAGINRAAADDSKCHMEQQCKWVNFKKVCVMVRVCR